MTIEVYPGYTQIYAHLDSVTGGLAVGWIATLGQIIGIVGATGNASNNPTWTSHLHFGVEAFGKNLSPSQFLNSPCPWSVR
ncbi:MAG: peptidoglycan DD-metalloendopeptidase family protein [Bryobacterales bacterium]|nr:peptidoglycan DD-metalloendopeptidase family protein [Bryobacterales bacterium]